MVGVGTGGAGPKFEGTGPDLLKMETGRAGPGIENLNTRTWPNPARFKRAGSGQVNGSFLFLFFSFFFSGFHHLLDSLILHLQFGLQLGPGPRRLPQHPQIALGNHLGQAREWVRVNRSEIIPSELHRSETEASRESESWSINPKILNCVIEKLPEIIDSSSAGIGGKREGRRRLVAQLVMLCRRRLVAHMVYGGWAGYMPGLF